TENESNNQRLFGSANHMPYVKDAFNTYVIDGHLESVNPEHVGTKAAAVYERNVAAGESVSVRLRLMKADQAEPKKARVEFSRNDAFTSFDEIFAKRQAEADEFYADFQPSSLSDDECNVQRQAFGGML